MNALPLLVTSPSRPDFIEAMCGELEFDDRQRVEAEHLFARGVAPLVDIRCLPYLFGVSPKLFGAMAERSHKYYRVFHIPKKDGATRQIATPRQFLKVVQRYIATHIIRALPVSPAAFGFLAGRNTRLHAAPHSGRRYLLAADIQDFFPTIDRARVCSLVRQGLAIRLEVAEQIAGLVTLDGSLPQGAPSSPAVANAAFYSVDVELLSLADQWGARYTRYADDLVFSREHPFAKQDLAYVAATLYRHGFTLNPRKSRMLGLGRRKVVTGLVVNERVQPPRDLRRQWRAMFHQFALGSTNESRPRSELVGIVAYLRQFDRPLGDKYLRQIRAVDGR